MKKIYVLKDGEVPKSLTTTMCMHSNDIREWPVNEKGEPVDMVAHFNRLYEGKLAHVTEDPVEIALFTKYLLETQVPYFYDVDNPTNDPFYYTKMPE